MTFTYDICVARYSEDLEWLGKYKKDSVIYNKTTELNEGDFKEVVSMEPIGLETYSFFCYIVDHYDNLPDVVAFIQGRVDDHLGDIKNTHSKDDKKNPIVFLDYILNEANDKGVSAPLDENVYDHMNWRLATPDERYKVCEYAHMTDWWNKYIDLPWPGPSRCAWSHNFAVRKDKILQHSKEKYIHIKNDPEFQHPYVEVSHFWERMLYPFFANDWN